MRIVECVQGTPEWWEAKRGIPSASNFDQIMTPHKRKASASQLPYITRLIEDIKNLSPNYFTGQGGPVNAATEYGRVTEAQARAWYEAQPDGGKVTEVGFCLTDDGRFGCSPDGLVTPYQNPTDEGGLELKCPERHTHLLYLMKGELPLEYKCQVHGSLIVTGRKWWDFVSYCKNEPALRIRVKPDEFTMALRVQLELFDIKYQAAKKRFNVTPQGEEPLTDLTRQTVEEHQKQIIQLEADMVDKGWQYGIDTINEWIKDMQDKPGVAPIPYQTKKETWKVLWAFCERQGWSYDTVNKRVMKEKAVAF